MPRGTRGTAGGPGERAGSHPGLTRSRAPRSAAYEGKAGRSHAVRHPPGEWNAAPSGLELNCWICCWVLLRRVLGFCAVLMGRGEEGDGERRSCPSPASAGEGTGAGPSAEAAAVTAAAAAAAPCSSWAPRRKRGLGGRAVSPSRMVGISPRWISFERWCAASSIRTQGVWKGSGNQDLTRQVPGCCLLLLITAFCLLLEMVATNMQCRSSPWLHDRPPCRNCLTGGQGVSKGRVTVCASAGAHRKIILFPLLHVFVGYSGGAPVDAAP